jgi:hypothetical protein
MNFQEGMRRIGLTAGIIGALGTGYATFFSFADVWAQRKAQAEFNSLLNLPIMQRITKNPAQEMTANSENEIEGHPQGLSSSG